MDSEILTNKSQKGRKFDGDVEDNDNLSGHENFAIGPGGNSGDEEKTTVIPVWKSPSRTERRLKEAASSSDEQMTGLNLLSVSGEPAKQRARKSETKEEGVSRSLVPTTERAAQSADQIPVEPKPPGNTAPTETSSLGAFNRRAGSVLDVTRASEKEQAVVRSTIKGNPVGTIASPVVEAGNVDRKDPEIRRTVAHKPAEKDAPVLAVLKNGEAEADKSTVIKQRSTAGAFGEVIGDTSRRVVVAATVPPGPDNQDDKHKGSTSPLKAPVQRTNFEQTPPGRSNESESSRASIVEGRVRPPDAQKVGIPDTADARRVATTEPPRFVVGAPRSDVELPPRHNNNERTSLKEGTIQVKATDLDSASGVAIVPAADTASPTNRLRSRQSSSVADFSPTADKSPPGKRSADGKEGERGRWDDAEDASGSIARKSAKIDAAPADLATNTRRYSAPEQTTRNGSAEKEEKSEPRGRTTSGENSFVQLPPELRLLDRNEPTRQTNRRQSIDETKDVRDLKEPPAKFAYPDTSRDYRPPVAVAETVSVSPANTARTIYSSTHGSSRDFEIGKEIPESRSAVRTSQRDSSGSEQSSGVVGGSREKVEPRITSGHHAGTTDEAGLSIGLKTGRTTSKSVEAEPTTNSRGEAPERVKGIVGGIGASVEFGARPERSAQRSDTKEEVPDAIARLMSPERSLPADKVDRSDVSQSKYSSESRLPQTQPDRNRTDAEKAIRQNDGMGTRVAEGSLRNGKDDVQLRGSLQDRNTQERIPQERISQDRMSQDRMSQDRISQDRMSQDRMSQDRNWQDRYSQDRPGDKRNPEVNLTSRSPQSSEQGLGAGINERRLNPGDRERTPDPIAMAARQVATGSDGRTSDSGIVKALSLGYSEDVAQKYNAPMKSTYGHSEARLPDEIGSRIPSARSADIADGSTRQANIVPTSRLSETGSPRFDAKETGIVRGLAEQTTLRSQESAGRELAGTGARDSVKDSPVVRFLQEQVTRDSAPPRNGQPESTLRNGQEVAGRNGQEVAGRNGQEVVGRNGQEVTGRNAQEVVGRNVQEVAGRNGQEVVGRNVQEVAGRNGQEVSGRNGQEVTGRNGQEVTGRNGQEVAGRNGQEVAGRNGQEVAGRNGQEVAGRNGQEVAGRNGQEVVGRNGQEVTGRNGQEVVGRNGQEVVGRNVQEVAGRNGQEVAGRNGQDVGRNGQEVAGRNGQEVAGRNGQEPVGREVGLAPARTVEGVAKAEQGRLEPSSSPAIRQTDASIRQNDLRQSEAAKADAVIRQGDPRQSDTAKADPVIRQSDPRQFDASKIDASIRSGDAPIRQASDASVRQADPVIRAIDAVRQGDPRQPDTSKSDAVIRQSEATNRQVDPSVRHDSSKFDAPNRQADAVIRQTDNAIRQTDVAIRQTDLASRQPDAIRQTDLASRQPDAAIRQTDASRQPDAIRQTDANRQPDAAIRQTDASRQPDAIRQTDASRQPDAIRQTDASRQPDAIRQTDAGRNPDVVRSLDGAIKPSDVANRQPDAGTRQPDAAGRNPDIARSLDGAIKPSDAANRQPDLVIRQPDVINAQNGVRLNDQIIKANEPGRAPDVIAPRNDQIRAIDPGNRIDQRQIDGKGQPERIQHRDPQPPKQQQNNDQQNNVPFAIDARILKQIDNNRVLTPQQLNELANVLLNEQRAGRIEAHQFPGLGNINFSEIVKLGIDSKKDTSDADASKKNIQGAGTHAVLQHRVKYTMQEGDTLDSIAINRLGDIRFAALLITINRASIVFTEENGQRVPQLTVGQSIWLPTAHELEIHRKYFFASGKKTTGSESISNPEPATPITPAFLRTNVSPSKEPKAGNSKDSKNSINCDPNAIDCQPTAPRRSVGGGRVSASNSKDPSNSNPVISSPSSSKDPSISGNPVTPSVPGMPSVPDVRTTPSTPSNQQIQQEAPQHQPIPAGSDSSQLRLLLERVRFAGNRHSVPLLDIENTPTQITQRKCYQIVAGETLTLVSQRIAPQHGGGLWRLLAQINGLPTETDAEGNPIVTLRPGQFIVLPTVEEINEFLLLERFAAVTSSVKTVIRHDAPKEQTVSMSPPEVRGDSAGFRRLAKFCRIVRTESRENATVFSIKLQAQLWGSWLTLASYECHESSAVRLVYHRDGSRQIINIELPSEIIAEMACEDFRRNWNLYYSNFLQATAQEQMQQA